MLWDMHLCVFDVRLSFENRVHTYAVIQKAFFAKMRIASELSVKKRLWNWEKIKNLCWISIVKKV